MMGALEAADGMLLFGISTAFIFTVMQFYYQHLVFQHLRADSSRPERAADCRQRYPFKGEPKSPARGASTARFGL
jgi:hypothetical protein